MNIKSYNKQTNNTNVVTKINITTTNNLQRLYNFFKIVFACLIINLITAVADKKERPEYITNIAIYLVIQYYMSKFFNKEKIKVIIFIDFLLIILLYYRSYNFFSLEKRIKIKQQAYEEERKAKEAREQAYEEKRKAKEAREQAYEEKRKAKEAREQAYKERFERFIYENFTKNEYVEYCCLNDIYYFFVNNQYYYFDNKNNTNYANNNYANNNNYNNYNNDNHNDEVISADNIIKKIKEISNALEAENTKKAVELSSKLKNIKRCYPNSITDANKTEFKVLYRKLLLITHPDKNPDNKEMDNISQILNHVKDLINKKS